VARNRKRAKERRARQPQPVFGATNGAPDDDEAPSPLEHAAPDAELAEAQLALGRPEFTSDAPADEADDDADADDFEELEDEVDGAATGGHVDTGTRAPAPLEPGAPPSAPRAVPGNRLVNFLQGSWRELQRVQWPDRRQVMQATSVVIGFVIVAGVFLGVADFLAGHIMNYILEGHW
jgi:preprotein translocase SecE subunit